MKYKEQFEHLFHKHATVEIGAGWHSLVDQCLTFFDTINKSNDAYIKVTQIKEKFGELRIYHTLKSGSEQYSIDFIQGYVTGIEMASRHVCEVCGCPGKRRTDRSWIKTLCDEHAK